MASRWIVDVDGRGLCAVVMEEEGRSIRVTEPMPREACERHIQYLREQDSARRPRSARAKLLASVAPESPQQSPQPAPTQVEVATPVQKKSLDLYAEGFYREPCRLCGKGIVRTGASGRAPTKHKGGCP